MDKVTRQFRIQQWAEALRDHKESGLTVAEWCKLHNVSKYQYYYRQRQVRKYAAQQLALQAPETSKPVFVEVDADMYQKPAQAEQTFPVVFACIRTGNIDILLSDGASDSAKHLVVFLTSISPYSSEALKPFVPPCTLICYIYCYIPLLHSIRIN